CYESASSEFKAFFGSGAEVFDEFYACDCGRRSFDVRSRACGSVQRASWPLAVVIRDGYRDRGRRFRSLRADYGVVPDAAGGWRSLCSAELRGCIHGNGIRWRPNRVWNLDRETVWRLAEIWPKLQQQNRNSQGKSPVDLAQCAAIPAKPCRRISIA